MLDLDMRQTRVYQEAFEKGYEQGIKPTYIKAFKVGFDAGTKEATIIIARRMLVMEASAKEIETATGLSLSAINRLKKLRGA